MFLSDNRLGRKLFMKNLELSLLGMVNLEKMDLYLINNYLGDDIFNMKCLSDSFKYL